MVLAAVGQFCATANLAQNAAIISDLIQQASKIGAKVLFLPEASDYIAPSAEASVGLAKPIEQSEIFLNGILKGLSTIPSGQIKPYISIGVHEPASTTAASTSRNNNNSTPSSRLKNTLLWISPEGKIEQRYQKLHLFDVDISNGPILKESKSVEPGQAIVPPFDTPIGKLGPAICYDIRFPEMALKLRSMGAQVLVYPSAFTVRTGAAHWHVLARARAIDTQCYVIMAALTGTHDAEGKRQSYGHSLIVDPWGTILAEASDIGTKPKIISADIDLSVLEKGKEKK